MLAEALTTLEKVHRMLGIPDTETGDDTYLEELIDAATWSIQEYCGRKFVRRNYNGATAGNHSQTNVPNEDYIKFSGKDSKRHALREYPISSAGFVLEELANRVSGVESWDTLTENEDYVLDRDTGIITMLDSGVFWRGERNYRVTMAAGYQVQAAAPWVPYDLSNACAVMVKEAYKEQDRMTSDKMGDIGRSYDLTKQRQLVEKVLDNYRSDANFA